MTKTTNAANPDQGAKRTSVNVEVEGYGKRCLFTLKERNDGDILVMLKGFEMYGRPPNGIKIQDRHISIHGSPNVPTRNMIHTSTKLQNGENRSVVSWTEAIKAKVGWAWIFSYRWPTLLGPHFADTPRAGAKELTLMKVDAKRESVVVSVFVGSAETEFKSLPQEGFTLHTLVLNDKKLVFFASILKVPPIVFGTGIFRQTFKAQDDATEEEKLKMDLETGSWPEEAVLAVAKERPIVLRMWYFEDLERSQPNNRWAIAGKEEAWQEIQAIGEIRIYPINRPWPKAGE